MSAPTYDLDTPLLDWQDGHPWDARAALSGTIITGSIGSGKSSGPGATLRRIFLKGHASIPPMGGLVLFAKPEADEWVQVCKECGRERDIIRITADGQHGKYAFNFLSWIAGWGEDGGRGPIPIVALLEEIATAVSPLSSGEGKGDSAFFEHAHRTKLTNLVHVIQLSGLPVSLPLMREISNSAPQTLAQVKDPKWRESSACWHILRESYYKTANDVQARKDWAECRTYLLHDYVLLSDRTKSIVEIMFTNLVRPFLTRPLRPMFCEGTNITPEMCFSGSLFLVDIPVQEYHQIARLAALCYKRCFQLAVLRRSGPPGSLRPTMWFCDEAQEFLSFSDASYQSVARSAGGVTCLLTQQISSIRQALGSQDAAENLLSNLTTKIFCQNSGETAAYASHIIGQRYTPKSTLTFGSNQPAHPDEADRGGRNFGINRQDDKRNYIEASLFQQLRRGGKMNGYEVDAVIFAGGKMFAQRGKKELLPFKILTFPQGG